MLRIKIVLSFYLLFFSIICSAQIQEINGVVNANSDLEGIHVINKTSNFYTTTNENGKFEIKVKLNDTLVFSSVLYKLESMLITHDILIRKSIEIELVDHVNELNEVFIGNSLSGNLKDDIGNVKGKPDINFYDVGIPGYTGKPKTQNERKLIEADHGKYFYYYGLGFSINVNKILNKVSGRTKILKNRVELDKKDALMYSLKAKYSKDLFRIHSLEKEKQMDYFYFCSEDENFIEKCTKNNDLVVLEFLKDKLVEYRLNNRAKD